MWLRDVEEVIRENAEMLGVPMGTVIPDLARAALLFKGSDRASQPEISRAGGDRKGGSSGLTTYERIRW